MSALSWIRVGVVVAFVSGAVAVQAQPRAQVAAATGPTVRLASPGAAPRVALRYRIAGGTSAQFAIRMTLAMRMSIGGTALPAVPVPVVVGRMTMRATAVGADGTVRFIYSIDSLETGPGYTGPAEVLASVRTSLASLVHTTGSGAMSNRGFMLDSQITAPPNANALARQTLDSLRDSLRQLAAPLPAEPVGRGARWAVTMPIVANGVTIRQVSTFTLDELRADRVRTRASIRQSAGRQAMRPPGLPPGTSARLESLAGRGTATQDLDLTQLLSPAHSQVSSDSTATVTAAGQSQALQTHVDVDVTLTRL